MANSRDAERLQVEQARRQAQVPQALDEAIGIIGELNDDVRAGRQQIAALQNQLQEAGTWRAKLKDWVLSGVIGTGIGLLVGLLFHRP